MNNKKFTPVQGKPAQEKTASGSKNVFLKSRQAGTVTCPHCWTDQRSSRNFCYQCGASFHYLDEQSRIG